MKIKKYLPIICTAGLSVVLFGLLLFLRGFYPFGNGSVMLTDMYDECVPSLYRFYDIIHGYKNIFYEFQASGGLNLYTETINEVCNPFNYLLLFWEREKLYLAVNVLLMLYVVGAACSAHLVLNTIWKDSSRFNGLLSICYAFSGYMAYNFQILRWMILPVIFPVFMLSCIRLWREQKGGLYAVLLAYQIVLSVQHGYMTLLFTLFASGIWMYCVESKDKRKKLCLGVGIYTLLGIMLSAVVLLPTISTLTNSSRSGANASYFAVFEQHGLKDLFERLFQFCHPLLLGMLVVIVYYLLKHRRLNVCWKDQNVRFYVLLNLFLWITVLLQPANLLWHMGSYVCFPVRYGYMLVFAMGCLIKSLGDQVIILEKEAKNFRNIAKSFCAVIILVGAIILLKSNELEIVEGFWTLTISKSYLKETGIVVIILTLLFAAAVFSVGKKALSVVTMFSVCAVCSFCYFFMISLPVSFRDVQELTYQQMASEYVKPEKNDFSSLIKRKMHNPDYPRNSSLINGKSSMSGYFPTAEAEYQYTMGNLGYLTPWVSTIDIGGTKISEYFFNHAIHLDSKGLDFEFEEENPLENQKQILDLLLTAESEYQESVFEITYGNDLVVSENGAFEIDLMERSTLYLDSSDLYQNLLVLVNGQEICLPMEEMQDDPHVLMCLGTFDVGKHEIAIYDSQGNLCPEQNTKIGILNEEKWEQLKNVNEFDTSSFGVKSQGFVCRITATNSFENGVVVLPMNATAGWKVFVDGIEKNVRKIGDCFIGIELENGLHELELQFFPPHFKLSCIISVIAVFTLAVICSMKKTVKNIEMLDRIAETMFVAVFLGAIFVVYVIPMLGLAVHLVKRIINII